MKVAPLVGTVNSIVTQSSVALRHPSLYPGLQHHKTRDQRADHQITAGP